MQKARARHILVKDKQQCKDIIEQIKNGKDFAEMAMKYSECPSKRKGGDLGYFKPGAMVPEFDAAVFAGDVGEIYGPVKTQFGYHIIEILDRQ